MARYLFVMDPLPRLDVAGDTTLAFMIEAGARGDEVWACEPRHLALEGARAVAAPAQRVSVRRVPGDHFTVHEACARPLGDFAAVFMRKDPPFDLDYYLATLLLERARGETLLVNDPRGLRDCNEKLYILELPDLIPATIVTRDPARVRAFLEEHGGGVIKPLDGNGGIGVFHLRPSDRNVPALVEMMIGPGGQRWVMVQRYLPEAREGDKRILLLEGEPLGAVLRVPRADDNRGNLHVGGRAERTALTPRDLEICRALAPRLRADGHLFVGIDVIGPCLTEINVTSPTGVVQIDALDGVRLAARVMDAVEARVAAAP